jgi:hypothetical protein
MCVGLVHDDTKCPSLPLRTGTCQRSYDRRIGAGTADASPAACGVPFARSLLMRLPTRETCAVTTGATRHAYRSILSAFTVMIAQRARWRSENKEVAGVGLSPRRLAAFAVMRLAMPSRMRYAPNSPLANIYERVSALYIRNNKTSSPA